MHQPVGVPVPAQHTGILCDLARLCWIEFCWPCGADCKFSAGKSYVRRPHQVGVQATFRDQVGSAISQGLCEVGELVPHCCLSPASRALDMLLQSQCVNNRLANRITKKIRSGASISATAACKGASVLQSPPSTQAAVSSWPTSLSHATGGVSTTCMPGAPASSAPASWLAHRETASPSSPPPHTVANTAACGARPADCITSASHESTLTQSGD
jgi:hypothetical protein